MIIEGRTIATILFIVYSIVSYFLGKDIGKEKVEIEEREERIKALEKWLKGNKDEQRRNQKMKKLENLERIRKVKGLTRPQLAKISGVNKTTIQFLESGINDVNNVKLDTLVKLSKALGCKVIDLVDKDLKNIIA